MAPAFVIQPPFPGADQARLGQAFAVRRRVFIEEQRVPEAEELDRFDRDAWHWLAVAEQGEAIGTARLLTPAPGVGKVGRVAVLASHRGAGVGKALMLAVIAHARRAGYRQLKLDSQVHARGFYERLGFAAYGEEFLDANIPHRHMALALAPDQ